jgi:hypothetical protein
VFLSDSFDLSHIELAKGLSCAASAGDTDPAFGGASMASAPCSISDSGLGNGAWPIQDSRSYSVGVHSAQLGADSSSGVLNILHKEIIETYYSDSVSH